MYYLLTYIFKVSFMIWLVNNWSTCFISSCVFLWCFWNDKILK